MESAMQGSHTPPIPAFAIKQEPQDPDTMQSSPSNHFMSPTLSLHDAPMEGLSAPTSTSAPQSSFFPTQSVLKDFSFLPRMKYLRSKQHVTADTYSCEVCQAEFSNHHILQTHKMCHFNTTHACYVCDTYFVHPEALIFHMATIHRQLHPGYTRSSGNDERDSSVCSVCLQRFSSKAGLVNHLNMHASRDANCYACKVCGLDFMGAQALMTHLTSPRHTEMKVKIQSIFVCVDCRSIFASRDSYAMHMMLRAQSETCKDSSEYPANSTLNKLQAQVLDSIANKRTSEHLASSIKIEAHEDVSLRGDSPLNLSIDKNCSSDFDPILNLVEVAQNGQLDEVNTDIGAEVLQVKQTVAHATGFQEFLSPVQHPQGQGAEPSHGAISMPLVHTERWKCEHCPKTFDSCDTLAMHTMTDHVKGQDGPTKWEKLKQAKQLFWKQSRCIDIEKVNEKVIQRPRSTEEVSSTQDQEGVGGDLSVPVKRSRSVDEFLSSSKYARHCQSGINFTLPEKHEDDKQQLACSMCKQQFGQHTDWLTHTATCQGTPAPSSIMCKTCNMAFNGTFAFSIHLRSPMHKRRMDKTDPPPIRPVHQLTKCTLCEFKTSSKDELADHYLAHSLNRPCDNIHKMNALKHYSQTTKVFKANIKVEHPDLRPLKSLISTESNMATNLSAEKPAQPVASPDSRFNPDRLVNGCREGSMTSSGDSIYSPESSGQQMWKGDAMEENSPSASISEEGESVLELVSLNAKKLAFCKHCKIIYLDRTVYYLHMGLHNLNNPWQCNLCGKVCRDLHEFSSHVMHYS